MRILIYIFFLLVSTLSYKTSYSQIDLNYARPEEYIIRNIHVIGVEYLDSEALKAISGLKEGDKIHIPGDAISNAIRKLWDNGLVGDIQVSVSQVEGRMVDLTFQLKERSRLSRFIFSGVKKSEREDLQDKISFERGKIVNDALLKNTKKKVENYFYEKGFQNAKVTITPIADTLLGNNMIIKIDVRKGDKVKVHDIIIEGNEAFSDKKLKKKMKKTKESVFYNPFRSTKFIQKEFEEDKQSIIEFYNTQGFRDARIVTDSVISYKNEKIDIFIRIEEGTKYYFRNITWTGNYIYPDSTLHKILNIKKGTAYSSELLQKRLNYNPSGIDISSLYLDNGYLFFNVDPVEILVEGDSIDIEMRIHEGEQATIDQVTVSGNTKTHDHVILREIYTLPGQKFSRTDLIRSQMALAQMGYFDTDQLGINPIPNPQKGTVDIHYSVVEKPSDQIELSGGWGGNFGFIGTVGLVFNNFSLKKLKDFKSWSPLPAGDGQRLSLRFQASGKVFQTLSLSFTEPWLGGKKPNSLTTSFSYSRVNRFQGNEKVGYLGVTGVSVGLGRRLLKFTDAISVNQSISYYRYSLNNYNSDLGFPGGTGNANNFSFTNTISRYYITDNQKNNPAFPKSGSNIQLSLILTPPYSLFGDPNPDNPYKFVEFHKWMLDNQWFIPVIDRKNKNSLVLRVGAHFGFIGSYKRSTEIGPFERFKVGGSGLSGFNFLLASELIGLRGYDDNSIVPINEEGRQVTQGGTIYEKLVFELRYPIHLSNAFSLFTVGFLEAGNNWVSFKDYNPFRLYRAAGFGLRINMPAFGMIGLDYGWPLDLLPGKTQRQGQFTFTIGQQIR